MRLTADNVKTVLFNCLFTSSELQGVQGAPANAVLVDGITSRMGFHKERLESHRQDICSMFSELPEKFFESVGGGWSFLNACQTESGEQWGEQRSVEDLLLLGMGLGIAKFVMPREYWVNLPGGMPYFVVNLNGFKKETLTA